MSDGVAVWGAGTGTVGAVSGILALGWQIYSWMARRRASVRVEISTYASAYRTVLDINQFINEVLLRVINRSEHPITVITVGVVSQDRPIRDFTIANPMSPTMPANIAPNAALDIILPFRTVSSAVALSRRTRGWVRLTTGERFQSRQTQVIPRGAAWYEDNLRARRHGPSAPATRE